MKWDVFVSYASEDKRFARRLAKALEGLGLKVWFDDFVLQPGDSLRRSIDDGLRSARYAVVILSDSFFKKEWPQKELDALVARESGGRKVVIPVWYRLTRDNILKCVPTLADKLAISYEDSVPSVANRVLRAVLTDRIATLDWTPYSLRWRDGSEMVVLPLRPRAIAP